MADFNSSLPVRTEAAGDVIVKLGDATTPSQQLAVDSSGRIVVKNQDGAGNNLTSSAAGATRPLDVLLRDAAGNGYTDTNPLPVTVSVNNPGTEVNNYNTVAAVAGGGTSNHDYTTAAAFRLTQIHGSASGKLKVEVRIETAAASGVFNTVWVGFNSTANPNIDATFASPPSVVSGARVRIIRTNKDNQSQDVYSTISGQE